MIFDTYQRMRAKGIYWAGPSLYHYVDLLISLYLYCDWQSTLGRVKNKIVLFYMKIFPPTIKSIYLKYLKSLQSGQKFELRISNDMWPHFSDPKSDQFLHIFGYIPGLYIFSYCMCKSSTFFEVTEGRGGVYCRLIPYWIK